MTGFHGQKQKTRPQNSGRASLALLLLTALFLPNFLKKPLAPVQSGSNSPSFFDMP